MADNTKIEWARHPETGRGATWNPITGCTLVSEGCRNCYAAELAAGRLKNIGSRKGLARRNGEGVAKFTGETRFNETELLKPLHWREPRGIFVCAHGDLFAEGVPDAWIDRVFAVMALAPQHIFMVLTKRPERMRDYFDQLPWERWIPYVVKLGSERKTPALEVSPDGALPNIWLGTSVEDQPTADLRIPHLLNTPAAKRFVSAEPLLGPVDARKWMNNCYECGLTCGTRTPEIPEIERCTECGKECSAETEPVISDGCPKCGGELEPVCPNCGHYMVYQHPDTPNLDWVIVGGESGRNARPMHPDWVRTLRDQCAAATSGAVGLGQSEAQGVPFLFKQWGEWIDADEWWRQVNGPTFVKGPDGHRWEPATPLNYRDAAILAGLRGSPIEPQSSGHTLIRLGKAATGRTLDGKVHDAMPEVG